MKSSTLRAVAGWLLAPVVAGFPLLMFETLGLGVPLERSSVAMLLGLMYQWLLPAWLLAAGAFLWFARARGLRRWWQFLVAGCLFGGAVALGLSMYLKGYDASAGSGLIGMLISYGGLTGAALHLITNWQPGGRAAA